MSPFEIDILLHYYGHSNEHDVVRDNPPIWASTRDRLLEEGFLKTPGRFAGQSYTLGDRGIVYINAIINLPWPIWAMPQSDTPKPPRE